MESFTLACFLSQSGATWPERVDSDLPDTAIAFAFSPCHPALVTAPVGAVEAALAGCHMPRAPALAVGAMFESLLLPAALPLTLGSPFAEGAAFAGGLDGIFGQTNTYTEKRCGLEPKKLRHIWIHVP